MMTTHAPVIAMPHTAVIAVTHAAHTAHTAGVAMPTGATHVSMPVSVPTESLSIADMDKAAVGTEHQYGSAAQLYTQFATRFDNDRDNAVSSIVGGDIVKGGLRQVGGVQRVARHAMIDTAITVMVAAIAVHAVVVEVVAVRSEKKAKPVFQHYLVS